MNLDKAPDADPARWVVEGTKGFAENVGSMVPHGFEAYARVFHPAWLGDDAVTWTEIAASNGRAMHPLAQWPHIAFADEIIDINELQDPPPGAVWSSRPKEGTLDLRVAEILADVLRDHMTTAQRCWFGVWEGWGGLRSDIRQAPSFELPSRRYFLLQGPIDAITETVYPEQWNYQSVSLWWPDDHAWCVATDIDLESTYVGASRGCVADLLSHPRLEALEVKLTDGVTWASDSVNPSPLSL